MDIFEYQQPTASQIERITKIRESCKALHSMLTALIDPSRERSLAITRLEEVSMWANKAIVFEDMTQ